MQRRKFLKSSTLSATLLATSAGYTTAASPLTITSEKYNYQLKYAPHLGMFKHHAGDDPIDQLKFMADQGFTAFEDNSMKGREVALQEKMAKTMMDAGMTMGVFVAHKIYWKQPNLASGKEDWRNEFLSQIKESVEVAKRVNAKWMTVVCGHVDLKQDMGYQTANVVESLKRAAEFKKAI